MQIWQKKFLGYVNFEGIPYYEDSNPKILVRWIVEKKEGDSVFSMRKMSSFQKYLSRLWKKLHTLQQENEKLNKDMDIIAEERNEFIDKYNDIKLWQEEVLDQDRYDLKREIENLKQENGALETDWSYKYHLLEQENQRLQAENIELCNSVEDKSLMVDKLEKLFNNEEDENQKLQAQIAQLEADKSILHKKILIIDNNYLNLKYEYSNLKNDLYKRHRLDLEQTEATFETIIGKKDEQINQMKNCQNCQNNCGLYKVDLDGRVEFDGCDLEAELHCECLNNHFKYWQRKEAQP